MPYIADYLWQDVLAAAREAAERLNEIHIPLDDPIAERLKAALEAAEGGSSDT